MYDIAVTLLVLLIGFIVASWLGYVIHWAFHQPWAGTMYVIHLKHHLEQYPVEDFLSEKYRYVPGPDTVTLFAFFVIPFLLVPFGLYYFHMVTLIAAILLDVELLIVAVMNDRLHDSFHIIRHPLKKYRFFREWTDLHYLHHVDMSKNFGIFFYGWDRVFFSFQKRSTTK